MWAGGNVIDLFSMIMSTFSINASKTAASLSINASRKTALLWITTVYVLNPVPIATVVSK